MTDLALLLVLLPACAGSGLLAQRLLRARSRDAADHLLEGLTVGLAILAAVSLVCAATGHLRATPVAVALGVMLVVGARDLVGAVRALRPPHGALVWGAVAVGLGVGLAEIPMMLAPAVGGDQTKYQLAYPRLWAQAGGLVATPWTFWGQQQFLENFLFAGAFVLRGDVLARLLSGVSGVIAALALAGLVRRHFDRRIAPFAGLVVWTLPMSWSLMSRAGADLPVVAFAALSVRAFLDWAWGAAASDLRRAALFAGLAGATKVMGLLLPTLVGLGVLAVMARRRWAPGRAFAAALGFGLLVLAVALPWYVRNAVETGNPIYPFGHGLFPGRYWSAEAGAYLDEYYQWYQRTYAARRAGSAYGGLDVLRFPWDLTMHPEAFENTSRSAFDISPLLLAFLPGVLLVRRRRAAVLGTAAVGVAFVAIIAGGAWAHPRYVLPGVMLALAACVPAGQAVCGRRVFAALVGVTIAGNLALIGLRVARPMWPDQVRVAVGRMDDTTFLRRYSPRWVFWSEANAAIPSDGRVVVLEKIPHPYYIERPFVLLSYLEQGLVDYRTLPSADVLVSDIRRLGAGYVAVDVEGLQAREDPYEARVTGIWRDLVARSGVPIVEAGGFALYALPPPPGRDGGAS
ncbi:MAG: glycosyltransferase family 39 protein [bacterium]|nr:glycosyltransferase family 39 protein [bacterium]